MIGAGVDFGFAARADDVARAVWSLQENEPPRCTRFFSLGSEGSMLPRSHLIHGCAPAFNLLMFSIGLAPSRYPNAPERSCWSARYHPVGPACISS